MAELIWRRGPWRSFEAVEFATLEWVDWRNNRRLLEPIGNIPPAEAEANDYAAENSLAMAAFLKPHRLRQNRGGSVLPIRDECRNLVVQILSDGIGSVLISCLFAPSYWAATIRNTKTTRPFRFFIVRSSE